jgi:hypothetical protein
MPSSTGAVHYPADEKLRPRWIITRESCRLHALSVSMPGQQEVAIWESRFDVLVAAGDRSTWGVVEDRRP